MNIKECLIGDLFFTYTNIPFRDQDVIVFSQTNSRYPWVSVIDGWTNPKFIRGNKKGREAALFIANEFPGLFQQSSVRDMRKRASLTAQKLDRAFLLRYPKHVSGVGAFYFPSIKIVVALSSIFVFFWNGMRWIKPKEQGEYSLPYPTYPSDVSRFFGRGELKNDPLYNAEPDVIHVRSQKPMLITTDGLLKCISFKQLNTLTRKYIDKKPAELLTKLTEVIKKSQKQNDDITLCYTHPYL